jgi:hypothetical protein
MLVSPLSPLEIGFNRNRHEPIAQAIIVKS